MDIPVYLLLVVTLVLLSLTILVVLSAVIIRARHKSWNRKIERYKKNLLPKVLAYLDDGEPEDLEKVLSGKNLEYYAFERIISEMLTEVDGQDKDRLQELLYIDPIFNHHYKLLISKNDPSRIKACNYFSNIRLVNFKVIKKLQEYLSSENTMLAFSAASALMNSKDVDIRVKALKSLAVNHQITKMALLELIYKFHDDDDQHNELEAEKLEELLEDEKVMTDNREMLIKGITEIGYYDMVNYLLDKLIEPDSNWNHPKILSALIKAQGEFNNIKSIPVIRQYLEHESPLVVQTAIGELSDYGSEKDFEIFYSLLLHKDNGVKEVAVNALLNNDQEEEKLIKWVPTHEKELVERFIDKYHTNLNK